MCGCYVRTSMCTARVRLFLFHSCKCFVYMLGQHAMHICTVVFACKIFQVRTIYFRVSHPSLPHESRKLNTEMSSSNCRLLKQLQALGTTAGSRHNSNWHNSKYRLLAQLQANMSSSNCRLLAQLTQHTHLHLHRQPPPAIAR